MNLFEEIKKAKTNIKGVAKHTSLQHNPNLSSKYAARVWLKREDLQPVRSYKLRGAYHKMSTLTSVKKQKGVVCASAGNHAQGVAYACRILDVEATIFMPKTTPLQKVKQVKSFGKNKVKVVLEGDTFDESSETAKQFCQESKAVFIHPFDDEMVIAGQGTIGLEILEDIPEPIDYLFAPIGGGGLASGLCTVFKQLSPKTKIVGVEPFGAASMKTSIENRENTTLSDIDKFVDGAAVKRVGEKTFAICRNYLSDMVTIPEGKICQTILQLYDEEAMVVEPAGALTVSALDFYRKEIRDKNVVCVISGGNNDITRMEEIKERALLYEKRKHYFMVNFPQRPGALKEFVNIVLGPEDDITYFQYTQKNHRESGPAVVGVELKNQTDFSQIEKRLKARNFDFRYLNEQEDLFRYLVL